MKTQRYLLRALIILSIIILTSCSQMPQYTRPEVKIPDNWRVAVLTKEDIKKDNWWHEFKDDTLNELVQTGLKHNLDILIASARVEEYMARYGAKRGELFPQINANAVGGRGRTTVLNQPITSNELALNLNVGWEIDLWGRIRSAEESAKAQILSAEEGRNALKLTIISSIIEAYVNLLNLDEQLKITKETVKTRKDYYEIFKLRYESGVISQLELNQAESEYESALASVSDIEKQIVQQENALSILIGKNPHLIMRKNTLMGLGTPKIPSSMPSELLLNRPDIRQAEKDLISSDAQIGVARAAFFPSISLTGAFGWASQDLSNLFNDKTKTWQWTGNVNLPIFKGGILTANLETAEALRKQALLKYQQVIQRAFREVEDALIEHKKVSEKVDILFKQIQTLKDYSQIARLRYENGYTSYLEVLDAERSLFNAEISYTNTKASYIKSIINLYKVLGGQWVVDKDV
ncbi:MAG: efflux transporter outer membrane subunit [Thermodesulfovibrionales bacterium]|nr:efflux transporter outer membrane subunit [Thermodesulfovibrionales bacterium]